MLVLFTDIRYYVLPRWTQEELKKVIAMLQNPEFDSKDIDPDLHKRMDKAVQDGSIKCFNMRESDADGDQDLHLWARELEDVVREILEDPVFKGNQNFKFEMDLDEAGKRLFGGEANAGVAFQIGQLRCVIYSNTYILCMYMYIPCVYMYIACTYYVYTLYIHGIYLHDYCMMAELEMGLFLLLLFCTLTEVLLSTRYLSGLFTSQFVI